MCDLEYEIPYLTRLAHPTAGHAARSQVAEQRSSDPLRDESAREVECLILLTFQWAHSSCKPLNPLEGFCSNLLAHRALTGRWTQFYLEGQSC